jgi:hypothetical protein
LVRGDKGSNNVHCQLKALKKVLIVSQTLPHGEAFDVLELHIDGRLGHHQHNGRSPTDAALDRRPDECPRAEKALLSVPYWSMNEVCKDVGGTTEGLHLCEQLCS